jgi:D-alanyl-D-alanine carboxypeptidase
MHRRSVRLTSRVRRAIAATTVFVTLAAACGSASTSSGPTSQEFAATLVATAEEFIGDDPGGVDMLVRYQDEVTAAAAGVADAEGTILEPGRPFRVGSISKTFVATMIMQLVDEDRIDLDAALTTYLPDTSVGAEVTIRQLLSHHSGLANYTDDDSFAVDAVADPQRVFSPVEILGYVRPADSRPVGTFGYANTNYVLLGQVLEAVGGVDLNTALSERITGPVGLTSTYFATPDRRPGAELVGGWSPGLSEGELAAPYDSVASAAWAAGALVTTTSDVLAFLDALVAGDLVSVASFEVMSTIGPEGFGLGLVELPVDDGELGIGHDGSIPGYTSSMRIDPRTNDALIVFTNNDVLIAGDLGRRILALD